MPRPPVAHKCRYLSLIFAVHGQEGNCMPTPPVAHNCGYLSLIFVVHIQQENCMPTPPVPHKCRYLSLIFAVHGQEGYYMPTPPGQGQLLCQKFPQQFCGAFNPLHLTISVYSLRTSLNTFCKELKRICLTLELLDVTVNSPLELLHIFLHILQINYKNLMLNQDKNFFLIILSILVTCLLDNIWIF